MANKWLDQRAKGVHVTDPEKTVSEESVLMSSHVMDDVERVCDRIVMIHKGKMVVHKY